MSSPHAPAHQLPVYRAEDFVVTFGAHEGDALSFARDLVLDDVFELRKGARQQVLALCVTAGRPFLVAEQSGTGQPGATLHLDSALNFMCPNGLTHKVLVLVEVDQANTVAQVYLFALTSLAPDIPYQLMQIDTAGARSTFAQIGSACFARGTRITLPTGEQRPIEDLRVGEKVLTRDDGPQPIRWIGQGAHRATGAMAPIRIAAGALHNSRDLMLSPEHRLFIYQREDTLQTGRPEIMVRARDLLGSAAVTRLAGGFVDYYQLVFDSHQIIYAEGIAAESMLIDDRSQPLVPPEVTARLLGDGHAHDLRDHAGLEVSGSLLGKGDATALLRGASTGS